MPDPRRYILVTFFLVLLVVPLDRITASASDPAILKAQAEDAFSHRYDIGQAKRAITLYEKILAGEPESEEYLVKLSYAYYWLGNRLELEAQSKRTRLEAYRKSIEAAREAVRVNPESLGGNYWLVISQGRYTQVHGILGGTFSLGDNIRGMQVVTGNNPNYYSGGVDRYWGRVVFEFPKIVKKVVDFKYEDALYLSQRSLAIEPKFFTTRLYMAETYLKLGQEEKAREQLTWLLTTSPGILPAAEAENRLEQELARRIWRKHFRHDPIPQ